MNQQTFLIAIFLLCFVFAAKQGPVVVNKLSSISAHNLVYSGYLPISDKSDDQLFFIYYGVNDVQTQTDLKKYPLLIVVGSPGSSAQFINLAGMGPIVLKSDLSLSFNPQSPTVFSNVMFIDLLGNGFSFISNTSNFPTKSEDYGIQLTYAINSFSKQSFLGLSNTVVLVGQGTFIRSLPGLDDIDILSGIIHVSAWPQLYAVSRYYGVAGIELKIFGSSQRIAIQSTLISCSNYIDSKKYLEAHNCYEAVLNFAESKTKSTNLYNVQLGSNLTDHMATIQYYFSQSSTVSIFKAPTSRMFDTHSYLVWNKTFTDLAVNKTANLSQFMKDYLLYKHWFIGGSNDFISYKSSIRYWLQNQLSFVESSTFKSAKLEDIVLEGETVGVGKQVKQVKYTEIFNSGHYILHDQSKVFGALLKDWLLGFKLQQQLKIVVQQSKLSVEDQ